jgi:DNA-binding transcriptional LysR family regulator
MRKRAGASVSLSSIQLEAFAAAARTLHFSRAAQQLRLTQSALSQRIKNLEDELGLPLFSRGPAGVRLTETGTRLLRYCQTQEQLETEILSDLVTQGQGELAGILRVAGYSSVMRSMIAPALAPLLRSHPKLQAHFMTCEMRELTAMLSNGDAEFVVLDHEVARAGIEARKLGEETYVLVESANHSGRASTYLDHDPDDPVTRKFLKTAGEKSHVQRSFLGDIYGIIDGVSQGLGRALVPKHLIEGVRQVRIVPGSKSTRVPIYLHFHVQPVYPRLHQAALERFSSLSPESAHATRLR